MKIRENEITLLQFILIIYKTQIGIGVLTLPREVADPSGTDGWIAVLIGWILAMIVSLVIINLMQKYETDTLFDLFNRLFGKWIGKAFSLCWVGYGAIITWYVIFTSVYIMQIWILPMTPHFWIIFLFLIPIYTITKNGLNVISRYSEFVYYSSLWMPPLLLFALKDSHWVNLLPVIKEGWAPIFGSLQTTILSFLGFEIAFLIYPFLNNKKKAYLGVIIANSMSMLIYMIVIIMSFIYFSPDQLDKLKWPTLNLLKTIEFPFIERFEIIFLALYFVILSMTVISYLYLTVYGAGHVLGKKSYKGPLTGTIVLLALTAFFYQPTFLSIDQVGAFLNKIGILFSYIFPFLLWIYIWFYRRLERRRT